MNKRGEEATELVQPYLIGLVIAAIIAVFFIAAANSFIKGSAVDKTFIARDTALWNPAWYAVSGNGYVALTGKITDYNSEFRDDSVEVSEFKNDPTAVKYAFVPMDGIKISNFFQKPHQIVLQKYGGNIDVLDSPHSIIAPQLQTGTSNVSAVYLVYDLQSKDAIKELDLALNNLHAVDVAPPNNHSLFVFFKVNDSLIDSDVKIRAYISSKKSHEIMLRNYNFIKTLEHEFGDDISLIPTDSELLVYDDAVILELNSDAVSQIRTSLLTTIGGLYGLV